MNRTSHTGRLVGIVRSRMETGVWLHLPADTAHRPSSAQPQRGSLLDTILRLGDKGRESMWEDTVKRLRAFDPPAGLSRS